MLLSSQRSRLSKTANDRGSFAVRTGRIRGDASRLAPQGNPAAPSGIGKKSGIQAIAVPVAITHLIRCRVLGWPGKLRGRPRQSAQVLANCT
jgi:hypothetical protein